MAQKIVSPKSKPSWYTVAVLGGKENSIINDIIDQLNAHSYYGPSKYVREIKVITSNAIDKRIFNKDDPFLPKNIVSNDSVSWKVLPDGKYERTKIVKKNMFSPYIYINMVYTQDIWYTIRNTSGVMGFVGSNGKKSSKPIPISDAEFDAICNYAQKKVVSLPKNDAIYNKNNVVNIVRGTFANSTGLFIKNVSADVAQVAIQDNGAERIVEVALTDIEQNTQK